MKMKRTLLSNNRPCKLLEPRYLFLNLIESDKYEKHSKYILDKIKDFDYWITDKEPDPDLVEALKDKVTILYDGKDRDYE